jgi:cell division protein FtsB
MIKQDETFFHILEDSNKNTYADGKAGEGHPEQ